MHNTFKQLNLIFFLCAFSFYCSKLFAHDGPPYPILVDHVLSESSKVSVWADPDTENGTFTFYIEGNQSSDLTINLSANPIGEPQNILKNKAELSNQDQKRSTYVATLPFTKTAVWNVTFNIGQSVVSLPVEVTPPGPTEKEFILYFLPFLAVGFIWVKVIITKNKKSK